MQSLSGDSAGRELVISRSVFPIVADFEKVKGFGAVEGGLQTLERLAQWLAGVKEPGADVEYLDHTP